MAFLSQTVYLLAPIKHGMFPTFDILLFGVELNCRLNVLGIPAGVELRGSICILDERRNLFCIAESGLTERNDKFGV